MRRFAAKIGQQKSVRPSVESPWSSRPRSLAASFIASFGVISSAACHHLTMGKKGKKAQAGKPKKLTPKDVGKRLDVLAKNLAEELEGADLFAPLPPTEDCPICLVPLSRLTIETFYQLCCGNGICAACYMENDASIKKENEENTGKKLALTCPFCREPETTAGTEYLRKLQARCLQNDHDALFSLGVRYHTGKDETPKDDLKALDCFIRAVEFGSPVACCRIATFFHEGNGVAVDKERAALFERIGALRGDIRARDNIGYSEYYDLGNHEIGIRHWKIAAEGGSQYSLDYLKKIYNADGKKPGKEFISKEEMNAVYRSGHEAQMEVKTDEREKHCEDKAKGGMEGLAGLPGMDEESVNMMKELVESGNVSKEEMKFVKEICKGMDLEELIENADSDDVKQQLGDDGEELIKMFKVILATKD